MEVQNYSFLLFGCLLVCPPPHVTNVHCHSLTVQVHIFTYSIWFQICTLDFYEQFLMKSKLPLNDRARSDIQQLPVYCAVSALQQRKQRHLEPTDQLKQWYFGQNFGLTGNPLISLSFKLKWTLLAGCRSSFSAKSICMVMMCCEWILHRHSFPLILRCYYSLILITIIYCNWCRDSETFSKFRVFFSFLLSFYLKKVYRSRNSPSCMLPFLRMKNSGLSFLRQISHGVPALLFTSQ